jgi:hypothetical protein
VLPGRPARAGDDPDWFRQVHTAFHTAVAGLARPAFHDQVVHGDLTGNVLRDRDRAAVIDWPPYWRPTGWALAVVGVDVVCWEGADPTLLDRWSTGPAWPQLLLRALVFRTACRGRHEMVGGVPPPDAQYLAVEDRLLDLVEDRL